VKKDGELIHIRSLNFCISMCVPRIAFRSSREESLRETNRSDFLFASACICQVRPLEMVRACAEHWRTQGVDLAAFNTNASADDLEDLRHALGAESISLLGHSYGTELALAAVRRHGEHLHRVVLASVQGPDDDLKLPVVTEFGLRRLGRFVAEDSAVNHDVPDLTGSLKQACAAGAAAGRDSFH
jgi:pimeloyl-ACP methyl ester carboxylesterase